MPETTVHPAVSSGRRTGSAHRALRLGLAHRLFMAFLAAGLVTAIGAGLATRWSFQEGIVAYLDQREVERIEAIALALARLHKETGDWRSVSEDDGFGVGQGQLSLFEPAKTSVPRVALPLDFVLYDTESRVIAGVENDATITIKRPVIVDGKVVATLFGVPRRSLQAEAKLRFWEYHHKASWLIGAAVALLAATVAFLSTRRYVARMNTLVVATAELGEGNYGIRVSEERNDEIGTLVAGFNAAATMLQNNEAMRRQFMADVSHELRTPLAVLRAELEAMRDGVQPINRESILSLEEETRLLTRLVDDIRELSLAEIGALRYKLQAIDLADVLEEEKMIWRSPLAATGIALEVVSSPGLVVRGDHDRLHQLLRNLIENTRRHARGADTLRVSLRRESEGAVIECHDNGPGVAEDLREKLFDHFWRADHSRTRDTGGTGLGLAICRSIVIAHNGKIAVHASDLGGLCIRLSIPLIEVPA